MKHLINILTGTYTENLGFSFRLKQTKTFHLKISLIWMKMNLWGEHIFLEWILHGD